MRENQVNHLKRHLKNLQSENPNNEQINKMLDLMNGEPTQQELLEFLNQVSKHQQRNLANGSIIEVSSLQKMIEILFKNE